jgi:hypothetical protein
MGAGGHLDGVRAGVLRLGEAERQDTPLVGGLSALCLYRGRQAEGLLELTRADTVPEATSRSMASRSETNSLIGFQTLRIAIVFSPPQPSIAVASALLLFEGLALFTSPLYTKPDPTVNAF